MQSKLDSLDEAIKSKDTGETVESSISTADGLVTHVYLGSKKKEATVAEFAESSTENGLTYPVFRKMLEDFLNQFYQAHNLPRERYLEIGSDQKVVSKILSLGHCLLMCVLKDYGVSVLGDQL